MIHYLLTKLKSLQNTYHRTQIKVLFDICVLRAKVPVNDESCAVCKSIYILR